MVYREKEKESVEKELEFHQKLYGKYTGSIASLVKQVKEERDGIRTRLESIKTKVQDMLHNLESLVWDEQTVSDYLESLEKSLKEFVNSISNIVSSIDIE